MNILLKIISIIIASIIVLSLLQYTTIKGIIIPAILIIIFYVIILTSLTFIDDLNSNKLFLNNVNSRNSSNNSSNNNTNSNNSDNSDNNINKKLNIIKKEEEITEVNKDEGPNSNLVYPKSGPFDNLPPKVLFDKLDTYYKMTSHPHKLEEQQCNKTYDDNQVEYDKINAPHSEKHLEITRQFYPQLSKNQINVEDCTNYGVNSNKSCNQSANNANLYPQFNHDNKMSLLINGIKDENDLKMVIKEDFNMPILTDSKVKTLFRNSPSNPNIINRDITEDLCRGCKVGRCEKGICVGN